MSGIVIRGKTENISYSGTQFDELDNIGHCHLCVRTNTGTEGIKKYALTTTPLNDKYKALKMQIPNEASGKEACVAQRYVDSRIVSVSNNYTSTQSSQYTVVETHTTASSSKTITQTASKSITQKPVYYGAMITKSDAQVRDYTTSYTVAWDNWFENGKYMLRSSGTSYFTSTYVACTATIYEYRNKNVTQHNVYSVTRTVSSTTTRHTSTITNTSASSSSTRTATASRTSEYTSSTSASSTETFTSHNVDI